MIRILLSVIVLLITHFALTDAQWVHTSLDSVTVNAFAVSGTNLFAGTGDWNSGGVFLSTNNGTSWTEVDSGLPFVGVSSLAVSGKNLFAVSMDGWGAAGSLHLSTDYGTSWTEVNGGPSGVLSFAVSDTNLFGGTYDGVFLSTDNGTSWSRASTGLSHAAVQALAVSAYGGGRNLFAGTLGGGVFLSTNNGTTWTPASTGLSDTAVWALAVFSYGGGINLFAGTGAAILDQPAPGGGVHLSTNNGESWTVANKGFPYDSVTQRYPSVLCFAADGLKIFAGTGVCSPYGCNGEIFLSTNNGASWTEVYGDSDSSWNGPVNALAVFGSNLFAGTSYGGVWRRPLSEMITSAKTPPADLPRHFGLEQNYPNPFNPTTKLSFVIGRLSFVTLKVYDTLGREVATLVNDEIKPGSHEVTWNANGFASGVYYYRMQVRSLDPAAGGAGSFVETKKLVLLR